MNNIITNFEQIVNQAQKKGLPPKKRGILREYLQAKIINILYNMSVANQLSFIGGTSLRLLRGLPRFSEDLDFDNLGVADEKMKQIVEDLVRQLRLENIEVELKITQRDYKNYFELKFTNLLQALKLTTDPREKLMIKIDYSRFWQGQSTQAVLFNDYGFIQQVLTNSLDQILVQKLAAYVRRAQTQPRDMFDVVWLYGQGARLDHDFMVANDLENLPNQALAKFNQEGIKDKDRRRLRPFLVDEQEVKKVKLLGELLQKMKSGAIET